VSEEVTAVERLKEWAGFERDGNPESRSCLLLLSEAVVELSAALEEIHTRQKKTNSLVGMMIGRSK
jgi:hypothetical protein